MRLLTGYDGAVTCFTNIGSFLLIASLIICVDINVVAVNRYVFADLNTSLIWAATF